jgi:predicted permease
MFKRSRKAADFAEEIKAHLELEVDEWKREGLSEEEARRRARVEFGNIHAAQERFYLRNRFVWFDDRVRDIKFALRQLSKAPGFTVAAVLTLALGIGANTAIFSLVNTLLLKPLPVPDPKQITTLALRENKGTVQVGISWNEYKQIREESGRSFSDVFATDINIDGLAVPGQQPDRIMTMYVSGNLFDGLGLKPAAGRLFLRSEGEVPGHDPVIVLGYDYWKQKFHSDPNVVGRPVTLDGHPVTIVGVAPKGFRGMLGYLTMSAYLPLSELPLAGIPVDAMNDWKNRTLVVNARLRPGVGLKQANATLNMAAQELTRLHPDIEKKLTLEAYPEAQLRINPGDPNAVFVFVGLFMSLAVMVLLLACVNVANLVLVRATAREREMSVRTALGASRSRLIAQMITESVTLALIGGAMGVVLGVGATSALGHIDLHADLPLSFSFGFDWRIFFYSFAVALLAGIVVSIAPALHTARANVNTVLHQGGRGAIAGRHWLRDGLVALQIAGSLVLLVVAALFVRSLSAIEAMDFGFKPDHVTNFTLDAHEIGMADTEVRDLAANITARLQQVAGVEHVSHASTVPFSYVGNAGDSLIIDGVPAPPNPTDTGAGYNVVSPEYFRVMGIDLIAGRAFTDADNEHGKDVAVVSESAARKFWPHQDPVGHVFRMAGEKDRKLEVVGIARDVEFQLIQGGKSQPFFYIPYAQHAKGNTMMVFQIRSDRDLLSLAPMVERAIHTLAPQLPVFQVQTMRQGLYTMNGLLLFQIGASLAAIMGGLGLTLAVIGLYGVVSYAVGRRAHEIGLRMALGASRASVFRMIYRQSVVIVCAGLVAGLAMALLVARAVGSMVVVSVWDPATYLFVATILALAAVASCYLPARRAMAVEPMVALRED